MTDHTALVSPAIHHLMRSVFFAVLVMGCLLLAPAPFASAEPTDDAHPSQAKQLNPKDAAFIVVRADFRKTAITVNDKPYPQHSKVGAAVAPNRTHEVVITDTGSQTTKRYRVRLKKGEARIIIVDISGGSPFTPSTARAKSNKGKKEAKTNKKDKNEDAKGSGFLTVNASPNAQVYIDGKLISSSTPLVKHTVKTGNHTVRVYYVDLKKFSETKRAKITEGRHINLYFNSNQKK